MSEIKASALIYCRTYSCDYDTGFLLRPNDFGEKDVAWARDYVLSATSYCDNLNGIRYVVFGNEKYLIFGIVCVLNNLFEQYEPNNQKLRQYALDKNGRNIKCFIGFVCHMQGKKCGELPIVSVSDLINVFDEHIAKENVWKNNNRLRLSADYEYELKVDNLQELIALDGREYVTDEKKDKDLFKTVLGKISAMNYKKVSLCTNMYNVKMLQDERYSYVTAGASAIERHKKKLTQVSANEEYRNIKGENEIPTYEATNKNTGITKNVLIIITVIITIIFIFLIGRYF